MDVNLLINDVIDREGDYSNHPDDRGGATRFGITEAVARQQGYAGPIRDLPRSEAVAIYRRLYWLRPGLDKLAAPAPDIAAELFDIAVNMGPATGIALLQRALNVLNRGARDYADVTVDGGLGPQTLAAIDGFRARRGAEGLVVLLKAVRALRAARYIEIAEARPANEAFVYGWLANRIG